MVEFKIVNDCNDDDAVGSLNADDAFIVAADNFPVSFAYFFPSFFFLYFYSILFIHVLTFQIVWFENLKEKDERRKTRKKR